MATWLIPCFLSLADILVPSFARHSAFIAAAAALLGVTGNAPACVLCDYFGPGCCAPGDGPPAEPTPIGADDTPTFDLRGGQWPQPAGDGSPVTLTYSYWNLLDGNLLDPDGVPVPADYIKTVIEEALGLWASVAPLHFVEVEDQGGRARRAAYPDGQFGQIRFAHDRINGPDPPGGPPTTKALAFFPSAGSNLRGDVFFDNSDPWAVNGTESKPDILGAAIHEIGHTLGLGHDSNPDSNMYWIFNRFNGPGTGELHFSDIAGVQAIYGEGVGSVTALSGVPEPCTLLMLATATAMAMSRRVRQPDKR